MTQGRFRDTHPPHLEAFDVLLKVLSDNIRVMGVLNEG